MSFGAQPKQDGTQLSSLMLIRVKLQLVLLLKCPLGLLFFSSTNSQSHMSDLLESRIAYGCTMILKQQPEKYLNKWHHALQLFKAMKPVSTLYLLINKALLIWFISHYVLNLEYELKVKEVALFFQFICNLQATGAEKKKNATYLSVTSDIQK